jgi:hypothetical protein
MALPALAETNFLLPYIEKFVANRSPSNQTKRKALGTLTPLNQMTWSPDESVAALRAIRNPDFAKMHFVQLRENHRLAVLRELFDHNFNWIGPIVLINEDDLDSFASVLLLGERALNVVGGLYDLADKVLDEEVWGIDKHNREHIWSNKLTLFQLFDLAEEHSPVTITTTDFAIAELTVIFHDVAQGLTGRFDHEEVGAILTQMVLVVQAGVEVLQDLPLEVARNVAKHTTKSWDHKEPFMTEGRAAARAMALISDEWDFGRARTTDTGLELCLDGRVDPWFFINYFIVNKEVVWDEEQNQPLLVIQTDIGDEESLQMYYQHLVCREEVVEPSHREKNIEKLKAEFERHFIAKNLTGTKHNLLKNAIRKVFGKDTKDFSVIVLDARGEVFFNHSSNYQSKSIRRMNK